MTDTNAETVSDIALVPDEQMVRAIALHHELSNLVAAQAGAEMIGVTAIHLLVGGTREPHPSVRRRRKP